MLNRTLSAIAIALCLSTAAQAQDHSAGDLKVGQAFARATVAGQPVGAAYVTIENRGKAADRLTGASTPVAKSVEIHKMSMENGVMRMREAKDMALRPGETASMKPGHGHHLMLFGLSGALKQGDKFPMTLVFEKAGKVDISVVVEDKTTTAPGAPAGHSPKGHGSGHAH